MPAYRLGAWAAEGRKNLGKRLIRLGNLLAPVDLAAQKSGRAGGSFRGSCCDVLSGRRLPPTPTRFSHQKKQSLGIKEWLV